MVTQVNSSESCSVPYHQPTVPLHGAESVLLLQVLLEAQKNSSRFEAMASLSTGTNAAGFFSATQCLHLFVRFFFILRPESSQQADWHTPQSP